MNVSLSNETFKSLMMKAANLGVKHTDHVRNLKEK